MCNQIDNFCNLDHEFPWFIVYIVLCAEFYEWLPILISSIVTECMKFYIGFEIEIIVPIVDGNANNSFHFHYWKSSYGILHFQ